jgi:hypothetical protein
MGEYQPILPADGIKRRKVCIVGFAGSTRDQYPKGDPDMERWGMNRLHDVTDPAPFHRWFQLHPREVWDTPARAKEVSIYREGRCPVYLHQHYEDIPASVPFPKAEIEQRFNAYLPKLPDGQARLNGESYQSTSVTWMIALALLEGFEEIHIYGVDMVTDEEYGYQRPCCEYWIGLAVGLGVRVVIPADSALCTQEWVYGYQMRPPHEGVISRDLLLSRRKGIMGERDQAMAAANFNAGRLAELDQLVSIQKHAGRGGKTGILASQAMGQKPAGPALVMPPPAKG